MSRAVHSAFGRHGPRHYLAQLKRVSLGDRPYQWWLGECMRLGRTDASFRLPAVGIVPATAIALGIFVCGVAPAATIHVPSEQPSISAAISAAATGDTITVAHGQYTGAADRNLSFGGKDLVLQAGTGMSAALIDLQDDGRFITFESGESSASVVRGIRIRNGFAEYGGAIKCSAGTSPTIEDCWFSENISGAIGGYELYGRPGGAICSIDASPTIRDCEFIANRGDPGGAMWISNSNVVIEDCLFDDNYAYTPGWGHNDHSDGGAIRVTNGSTAFVTGCTFTGNTASSNGGWYAESPGGAIHTSSSALTLDDCSFSGNASYYGNSIAANGEEGQLDIVDCEFAESNSAVTVNHAVFSASGCSFTGPGYPGLAFAAGDVSECLFTGIHGTVMSVGGGNCVIRSCTVSHNDGPITCVEGAIEIEQTVLSFGGAAPIDVDAGDVEVHHCVVFGHAGGDSLPVAHHDNLFVDPLFCAAASRNFTLCEDSPCRPGGNDWYLRVGAFAHGCGPCNTVVVPMSWGRLKALYR